MITVNPTDIRTRSQSDGCGLVAAWARMVREVDAKELDDFLVQHFSQTLIPCSASGSWTVFRSGTAILILEYSGTVPQDYCGAETAMMCAPAPHTIQTRISSPRAFAYAYLNIVPTTRISFDGVLPYLAIVPDPRIDKFLSRMDNPPKWWESLYQLLRKLF